MAKIEHIHTMALLVASNDDEEGCEALFPLHASTGWDDADLDMVREEFARGAGTWQGANTLSEWAVERLYDELDVGPYELRDIYVMYVPQAWVGRVVRGEEASQWVMAETEINLLEILIESHDGELDEAHPGLVASCPRCGAPEDEAKMEHVLIKAKIFEQRFDPKDPRGVTITDACDVREHWVSCASCGAQDISVSELVINAVRRQ